MCLHKKYVTLQKLKILIKFFSGTVFNNLVQPYLFLSPLGGEKFKYLKLYLRKKIYILTVWKVDLLPPTWLTWTTYAKTLDNMRSL